jgi:hypothetical protein
MNDLDPFKADEDLIASGFITIVMLIIFIGCVMAWLIIVATAVRL